MWFWLRARESGAASTTGQRHPKHNATQRLNATNPQEWATEHPFLAAVAVVGGSFALVYVLSRISRGTRRRHGGYVNEKGVERLD